MSVGREKLFAFVHAFSAVDLSVLDRKIRLDYPGRPSSLSASQQCEGAKFWALGSSSFPPKPARLQQLALELAADFLHGGRVGRAFGGSAKAAAAKPKWRSHVKSFVLHV